MKLQPHLQRYQNMADEWLARRGHTRDKIVTGRDAWTVSQNSGITFHAYQQGAKDTHIRTVLERLFPNAVFQQAR